MSWFDPSGFANIAKSALREAQKTIDKALDIRDDGITTPVPANTPIDTNSDDLFGSWGFTQSGNIRHKKEDTTLWGSFTGSFFDVNKDNSKSPMVDSLDDPTDAGNEHFAGSKLVVQQSDDGSNQYSRLSSMEVDEDTSVEINGLHEIESMVEVELEVPDEQNYVVKTRKKPSSLLVNRLSFISNESGKNSSESVELITCSTECTASPESELLSGDQSISTSTKQTSESVEILADVTSLSFTEISGSDNNNSSGNVDIEEFASPLESPIVDEEAR